MIIEFRFGNFRSFRDEQSLSLIAASKLQHDPALDAGNVVRVREKPELNLLRVAALYGANASGKSNVIKALEEFRDITIRSANVGFLGITSPFYLNTHSYHEPTSFEITFLLPDGQYRYGFEVSLLTDQFERAWNIHSEWLYRATTGTESNLFERENDQVILGSKFQREGKPLIQNSAGKGSPGHITRKGALLLSMSAQIGGEVASRVVSYIQHNLRTISGLDDDKLLNFTLDCLKTGAYKDEITSLMANTDSNITDVVIEEIEETIDPQLTTAISNLLGSTFTPPKPQKRWHAKVKRQVYQEDGNTPHRFPLSMSMSHYESLGTQKMFAYSGAVIDALRNGHHLFVDEMDARFHPLLTKQIVELFQSPTANPKNAQLVFVTHDTNLLDPRRLRRDQIWFVEKDRFGASHLYSLAEYKGVRKDSDFAEEYLRGRYGAIPFLGGFANLFEQTTETPEDAAREIG